MMKFKQRLLHSIKHGMNDDCKLWIQDMNEAHKRFDDSGATLLHYAAEYGNGGIAKYLVELGADVNAQDSRGQTPLMLAIREDRVTTIRSLLDDNASIHIPDENGRSALQMVVQGSLISEYTIQAFLTRLTEETSSDIRLLAQKLRDINCPLRAALFLNDVELTRILLDGGYYNVDDPDPEMGETALHIAVRLSSPEHVKLLIEYGANVNALTVPGSTPIYNLELQSESDGQGLEILKTLLDRGAMIFTETENGRRCQVSCILEYGCKKAINLLMQYDVDLCDVDVDGSTVLHYLARNYSPDVFDELEGRKFDVNARNNELYTPLHLAKCNYSSLRFLLDNGADFTANRNGATPFSVLFEQPFLLKASHHNTGRFEACRNAELYLQRGADPQLVLSDGTTIFDRSLNCYPFDMPHLLLAYLVLLEDTGTPIIESIRNRIDTIRGAKEFYNQFKVLLNKWKTLVVCESITMYKLLTVSKKQLAMYMRRYREDIVAYVKKSDRSKVYSLYTNFIGARVIKAISTAELWKNATSTFCDILELPHEKYYDVIERMVIDYLSEQDMRNLCLLNEK